MMNNMQILSMELRQGGTEIHLWLMLLLHKLLQTFHWEVRVQKQSAKQAAASLCCQLGSQALNTRPDTLAT